MCFNGYRIFKYIITCHCYNNSLQALLFRIFFLRFLDLVFDQVTVKHVDEGKC